MGNLPNRELSQKSKKDILELPFREVTGIKRLGLAFRNMLIANYRRPLWKSNDNKKCKKIIDMPLKKLLRHGERKISVIIYKDKSPYWKTWEQKGMLLTLDRYEKYYLRKTLKKIQRICKELGFTKEDGPFMAIEFSTLLPLKNKAM